MDWALDKLSPLLGFKDVLISITQNNMIVGVFILLVGVAIGATLTFCVVFWNRYRALPWTLTEKDKTRNTLDDECQHEDENVYQCFQREKRDWKHLIRNLDHFTRPSPITSALGNTYNIHLGNDPSRARLIQRSSYTQMQLARKKQIKACAAACGLTAVPWDDIVDEIKKRPEFQLLDDTAYTQRIERVLQDEYNIQKNVVASPPPQQRRSSSSRQRKSR